MNAVVGIRCGRLLRQRVLVVSGRPYERKILFTARTEGGEVPAGLGEAVAAVRSTTNHVGVVVVLTVVLPETHRADLVLAACVERQVATAGARVRSASGWSVDVERTI